MCWSCSLGTVPPAPLPPPSGEGEPRNRECHRVKEEKGFSGQLLGLVTSALFSMLYPPLPSHPLQVQPLATLCQDPDVKGRGHPSEPGQLGSKNGNLDLGLGSVLKVPCCLGTKQGPFFFKLGLGSASRMLLLGSICPHLTMCICLEPSSWSGRDKCSLSAGAFCQASLPVPALRMGTGQVARGSNVTPPQLVMLDVVVMCQTACWKTSSPPTWCCPTV